MPRTLRPRAPAARRHCQCRARVRYRTRHRARTHSLTRARARAFSAVFVTPARSLCWRVAASVLGTRRRRLWEVGGSSGRTDAGGAWVQPQVCATPILSRPHSPAAAAGTGGPVGNQSLPHVDPLLPAGLWGAGVQERGLSHCPHAPFRGQHPCVLCWWLSVHTSVVGSFVPGCPLWPSPVGTAALCSFLLTSPPPSHIPIQPSVDPTVMGEAYGFQMLKGLVHLEINTFVKLIAFLFF